MPSLASITAAEFKARYPAFEGQPDTYVNAVLDEARGSVNDTWIEGDRVPALLAYTAYLIASEATAGASIAVGEGGTSVGISGTLTEVWVGDVKAKFADGGSSGGGGGSGEGSAISPAAALYWQQYMRLYRRSFPAVMVV
ncbi:DUF4054 domain-containing protein [Methylorubrum extorquens]|uniref:DUF4054 domain-containing protein n=1 Tax=Methylorubrum extorquens DSM 13060 TaxID=882800 RepID=H1KC70_METEX|nr:DUF4054 domain-containing protein [Methylorubrum extorquens]EHP94887.1 hypothetical protein MetexDRAFT_0232 [Methylorubrum extorquens DSM 13060]